MKILIFSATINEIQPLLTYFEKGGYKNSSLKNNSYNYKNHNIDVLISGVGMVNTTYHLTKVLSTEKYDLVLNAGIAGSFDKSSGHGEVVNVTKDIFSEMGAESQNGFIKITEMQLGIDNTEIINNSEINNSVINTLKKVTGITVSTVHGNETSISRIMQLYNPDIETMEGAAFLYVCIKENTPCAQIRSISNYVENRDRQKWNIPIAIENLNKTIINILDEF